MDLPAGAPIGPGDAWAAVQATEATVGQPWPCLVEVHRGSGAGADTMVANARAAMTVQAKTIRENLAHIDIDMPRNCTGGS